MSPNSPGISAIDYDIFAGLMVRRIIGQIKDMQTLKLTFFL
jgi:hypothetical protein